MLAMAEDLVEEVIRCDDAEKLAELIAEGVVDPKRATSYGTTALMDAAEHGAEKCVKLLLPMSDAKLKDKAGWTALMSAAHAGCVGCVEALLPVSDAKATDALGRTALKHAQNHKHFACVKALSAE